MPSADTKLAVLTQRVDEIDEKLDTQSEALLSIAKNVNEMRLMMAEYRGGNKVVQWAINLGIGVAGVLGGIFGFGSKH